MVLGYIRIYWIKKPSLLLHFIASWYTCRCSSWHFATRWSHLLSFNLLYAFLLQFLLVLCFVFVTLFSQISQIWNFTCSLNGTSSSNVNSLPFDAVGFVCSPLCSALQGHCLFIWTLLLLQLLFILNFVSVWTSIGNSYIVGIF